MPRYNEYRERIDQYRVVLFAYCGMRQTLASCENYSDARIEAAGVLRDARERGQCVLPQVRGQEWELCEPEDCALVPDHAGILAIRFPSHVECDDDCED